ncbi:PREDICTED: defensin-like protein 183 [Camelina sativa]|uniref:Defensin-like protein n=1 Tax=Camelina sativa TaxID=90675 RepID=A0ABM0UXG8_CAMSA|nr:PREDICTED: defensin-like protein 183 [Camelina sativa]
MEKAFSLLLFIIFFIMFASVENKINAKTCMENLGYCEGTSQQCDERCKAKHGPEAEGECDVKGLTCTCFYPCGQGPSPLKPKICYGGAGVCSDKCGPPCCNQNCAEKYNEGTGFCDSIGHTYLCKCQYTC